MKVLDNRLNKFGDDLKDELKAGDKCNIASAVFSMYSYNELKKQLKQIDEFNFIFTNPTFIKEKKEQKNEIKKLESKIHSEKQFNIKVQYNEEIIKIRKKIEELNNVGK